ncbi:MAG: serine protease [Clostridiales bacterium]|nr:serine protease [Clostridiales bacterium]
MYTYKKKNGIFKMVIACVISSLVTFGGTWIYFNSQNNNQNNINSNQKISYTQNEENSILPNTKQNSDTSSIFNQSIKSVVGISVLNIDSSSIFDNNSSASMNMGSGIIVSSDGYIVTNQHVAGSINNKVIVTLENGSSYDGITKWVDEVLDLAIVKINAVNLDVSILGDSDTLNLGEAAYAIGNPLGMDFQRTITSGIISALNRTIKIGEGSLVSYMQDLIQTDAAINSGNSGGPLINSKGEVIGINTIKVTGAEGIGFAIPINIIKPIIESYINNGSFEEAYLGIFAYDNKLLGYLNSNMVVDDGICIANIDKFGPLKNSKMKVGDILLSIDGNILNTMVELRKYLYTKKPLDTVEIKYMTVAGVEISEKITLSKKK